jgi:hypothetical protein
VRAAWSRGDVVATHAAVAEGVETLAEVRFAETEPATMDPRELAKAALGEPSEADADDSPRKLAGGLSIY